MSIKFGLAAISFAMASLILATVSLVMTAQRLSWLNAESQSPNYQMDSNPPSASTQELTQLKNRVDQLEQLVSTLSANQTKIKSTSSAKSASVSVPATQTQISLQDRTIYLGSGSTNSQEWTTITTTGVNFNLNNYQNAKDIRFEANLAAVSGIAYARLYDQTTNSPVYSSEVYYKNNQPQWITSLVFNLPSGDHYYVVQLKSSSGETVSLSGARLKFWAR